MKNFCAALLSLLLCVFPLFPASSAAPDPAAQNPAATDPAAGAQTVAAQTAAATDPAAGAQTAAAAAATDPAAGTQTATQDPAALPDLSGLSLAQLLALRDQLNLAIWSSADWQEVTVPAGVYQIGADIPAGHWTVRAANDPDFLTVFYFSQLDTDGVTPSIYGDFYTEEIASPGYNLLPYSLPESVSYEMAAGWFFKCSGPVIFTPYSGQPVFSFR